MTGLTIEEVFFVLSFFGCMIIFFAKVYNVMQGGKFYMIDKDVKEVEIKGLFEMEKNKKPVFNLNISILLLGCYILFLGINNVVTMFLLDAFLAGLLKLQSWILPFVSILTIVEVYYFLETKTYQTGVKAKNSLGEGGR